MEGRVIDLELFQSILYILVLLALCRINPAVNHGLHLFIAGQRLRGRIAVQGDRVTDSRVRYLLDAGADISNLSCPQFFAGHMSRRVNSHFRDFVFFLCIHQADHISLLYFSIKDTGIDYNTFIVVIIGIEDQRFQLPALISGRSRDFVYHLFQKVLNADPLFGGN